MGLRGVLPRASQQSRPEGDDKSRFSVFGLIGLAAGGMIGSGWLLGAVNEQRAIGFASVWAWVIGGALILVLGAVMVELGTAAPRSGGLIFLPLQSSGPLVATVVATALWIFYAINAAGEAVAMTTALAAGLSMLSPSPLPPLLDSRGLSPWGEGCAVLFLAIIAAVNLFGMRTFIKINNLLTLFKVLVPILVVVLLFSTGFRVHGLMGHQETPAGDLSKAWPAVVGGSVLFAYIGFQGPLDFAGDIKRQQLGEAARLRRAVYGALIGTIVLYCFVQLAVLGHGYSIPAGSGDAQTETAIARLLGWAGVVFMIDAVVSPLGSGLVFARVLTREVAALSRNHLAHRGLQTSWATHIKVPGRPPYETYWVVLLVDFVIGCVALLMFHGSWMRITGVIGILALVVYAVPGVVLVALRPRLPFESRRRWFWRESLARVGFFAVALVLYRVEIKPMVYAMGALALGSALLLLLPVLSKASLPLADRLFGWYEAHGHVALFRRWRSDPAVWTVTLLMAYLAGLTLAVFVRAEWAATGLPEFGVGAVVLVVAGAVFEGLVWLSRRYTDQHEPDLPTPRAVNPIR